MEFPGIDHAASHLKENIGTPGVYNRLHIDSGGLNSGSSVLLTEPSLQALVGAIK